MRKPRSRPRKPRTPRAQTAAVSPPPSLSEIKSSSLRPTSALYSSRPKSSGTGTWARSRSPLKSPLWRTALRLPAGARFHNVVHASQLEPWTQTDRPQRTKPLPIAYDPTRLYIDRLDDVAYNSTGNGLLFSRSLGPPRRGSLMGAPPRSQRHSRPAAVPSDPCLAPIHKN